MILVDANVLLDIANNDPRWASWSSRQIAEAAVSDGVAINVLIFAEVLRSFADDDLREQVLGPIERLDIPFDAAGLANRAFRKYRELGGVKTSPLVDFFIGAHAEASGLTLLTRDSARFRTYFPGVTLITPENSGG